VHVRCNSSKVEGSEVVDVAFPARLRWYSSMLDCTSLVAVTSDVTKLEGTVADAVCPGRWRMNSSLLKPPSSEGALERKAPGRETSWSWIEENLPWNSPCQ
jgi:hypothetical protein